MDNFPPELEVMVLERTPPNDLYSVQQVKQSWRFYILKYGHRLRSSFLSEEERTKFYRILWRIGQSPQMKHLWREEIINLKMTDYQFEAHACDELSQHLISLSKFLRSLEENYINLMNSQHLEGSSVHLECMLRNAEFLDLQGAYFHRKEKNTKQIRAVFQLCEEIYEHVAPQLNQAAFNQITTAKAIIAENHPYAHLAAWRDAVDSIPGPKEANPARLLGILYRMQGAAFPAALATVLALEAGIKQYKADLVANNLW